jgi:polysaccharide pyruvyl transferase WcaK-like protein
MKNILFATVRQGNCGDEFILFGVLNIISSLQAEYNPVILNKNVEVCRRLALRNRRMNVETDAGKKITLGLENLCFSMWPALHDDSLADYHDLNFIDAVVFAGTPEWMGYKLDPLYKKLEHFEKPIFFLGPGFHEGLSGFDSYSNFYEKPIHQKAKAFAVRDRNVLTFLTPDIDAVLLPCPALLCAPRVKKRSALRRIGFSLHAKEGDAQVVYVSKTLYAFCLKLLEAVSKYCEVEVVCHWIEDLICLQKDIGDRYPLRYSFDAKDYLDIYDRYDLVVSTRVHGSGMAASLGIPTFTIANTIRTDTVWGFLSEIITSDEAVETACRRILSLNISETSGRIIAHKKKTLIDYQTLLSPYFPL